MSGRLMYIERFQSSRPARCRHCGEYVGYASRVVIDSGEPWLAFHAECLRELLPERVEQLCLDMEAATPTWRSVSSEFRKRIEHLRDELKDLERFTQSKEPRMHPWFRPGQLRNKQTDA